MSSQQQSCQNCKQTFTIEPQDIAFYEKLKVPSPTFCPGCRMQRRFAWRNERFLYKRPDNETGRMLFSAFPPEALIKTVAQERWSSDEWDPMKYGREYDFSKPFFQQFKELMSDVPFASRWVLNIVNADYNINTNDAKNCYLVMSSSYVEDCAYSVWLVNTQNSMDLYNVSKSSFCYESTLLRECSRVFFSTRCESSQNLYFCRDCVGCTDCFGCVDIRNKSYCIFNKQYSKEEYAKKLSEFGLHSYAKLLGLQKQAQEFWMRFPVRYVTGRQSFNTTGEYISNSKNVLESYNVQSGEELHYCQNILSGPAKDSYDYANWGENAEQMYDSILCGLNISNARFCLWCWSNDTDLTYCMHCRNSSHLFGCIGLNNKQYCILNKQYNQEEYETLVPKIIDQMSSVPYIDKTGNVYKYGEFYPMEISISPYNETLAQEYFPITKEQAVEKGYFWHEEDTRSYTVTKPANKLPDSIQEIEDSILKEVIGCAHEGTCNESCTRAFKLTGEELAFYRRFNFPLPRLCFNCRHSNRLKQRNEPHLYQRHCQCAGSTSQGKIYQNVAEHGHHDQEPCPNEFKTAYSPEREEVVYCEQCYQAEVI